MTPSGQTICLCMIVKNEAPVIRRCLDSVRPIIDHWIIVDTGSTDGTQEIVRAHLRDLPGTLIERPWQDFAHNRSEALAFARSNGDYSLIIDADDNLEIPAGFQMQNLNADSYVLDIEDKAIRYRRTQLVKSALSWRYEGVLHEYLKCDGTHSVEHLPITMRRNHDGARRRDPQTYRKDAAILERALKGESDPGLQARYTFYLAQSYRDCGEKAKAVDAYLDRAAMGLWDQEVFVSLLNAGRLMEALGRDPEDVLAIYQHATEACSSRSEAAHAASRLCRDLGRNKEGYTIAKRAIGLKMPADGLFVESWIYSHGLLDEFAVNAYWAGFYRECEDACLTILSREDLSNNDRQRILANARFAFDKSAEHVTSSDAMIWPVGAGRREKALAAPPVLKPGGGSGSVSVITPTRNRASFLKRALTYFRSQSHRDIEWLILDDSPNRPETVADFAARDISYEYSDRSLSIGEKRNILIEKARGDLIVQFDDDDYYAPDYVRAMISALTAHRLDLVNLRGWFLYDLRSHFFGYWDLALTEGLHYRCDQAGIATTLLSEKNNNDFKHNRFGYGFTYAFRKSIHKFIKFEAIDWNEDGRFFLKAMTEFRTDGLYDTTGLCLHLLHAGSTSRCFPQHHLPQFLFENMFPNLDPI